MEKDNILTELMEKKTFEELTMSEKSLVLLLITETEYNERHTSLLQMKKELKAEAKELKANENIRLATLQVLREKQETKGHNRHICHSQTWSQLVTVFVTVLVTMKNRHRVLKLTVTVVTVVRVFGRIRKKNSV